MKKSAQSGHKKLRYRITVTTRASRNKIEPMLDADSSGFHMWVTAVPERGKANKAVIALLSEHLNVPKSRITIIAGQSDRHKVVEIE